jgi:Cutinase
MNQPRRRRVIALVAAAFAFAVLTMMVRDGSQQTSVRLDGATLPCRDIVVMGVRESGAPPTGDHLGSTLRVVSRDIARNLRGQRSVATYGLRYPAEGTQSLFDGRLGEYFASIDTGVSALRETLQRVSTRCDSWIVVLGYSQGALVVRRTLAELSPSISARIAGVGLFGDPARGPNDGTTHRGNADRLAKGIHDAIRGRTMPVPMAFGPRLSWCNKGDAICASDAGDLIELVVESQVLGGSSTPHGRYSADGSATTTATEISAFLRQIKRR